MDIFKSCEEFSKNPVTGKHIWKENADKYSFMTALDKEEKLTVFISCCYAYSYGKWVMNCKDMGIISKNIRARTAKGAAREAMREWKKRLNYLNSVFSKVNFYD